MAIEWRNDLETGDNGIDGQHKEMFRRINELITACKQGREKTEVASMLFFLRQYVQSHFSAEASYQAMHHYQNSTEHAKQHAKQHANLVASLATLENAYLTEGASLPVVTNSLKLTYEWLTEHILVWDKKMRH